MAADGCVDRCHTGAYRYCQERRLRRCGLARHRRRQSSLYGHPFRRRACETVSWLTSERVSCCDMRRLWLQVSEPAVPPEVSLPIGSHYVSASQPIRGKVDEDYGV